MKSAPSHAEQAPGTGHECRTVSGERRADPFADLGHELRLM
jgi:hypothetical protein